MGRSYKLARRAGADKRRTHYLTAYIIDECNSVGLLAGYVAGDGERSRPPSRRQGPQITTELFQSIRRARAGSTAAPRAIYLGKRPPPRGDDVSGDEHGLTVAHGRRCGAARTRNNAPAALGGRFSLAGHTPTHSTELVFLIRDLRR